MRFTAVVFRVIIITAVCCVLTGKSAYSWEAINVSASPSAIAANGSSSSIITAHVWNVEEGEPAAGVYIYFGCSMGALSSYEGVTGSGAQRV